MQQLVSPAKLLTLGLTEQLLQSFEVVREQFFKQPLQFKVSMARFIVLFKKQKLEYLEVLATFPLEFLRYFFAVAVTRITDVEIQVFETQYEAAELTISQKFVLLVDFHNLQLAVVVQRLLFTCPLSAKYSFEVVSNDLILTVLVTIKLLSQFIRVQEWHCVLYLDFSFVADFSRALAVSQYFFQTHSCRS